VELQGLRSEFKCQEEAMKIQNKRNLELQAASQDLQRLREAERIKSQQFGDKLQCN
jgi:hypothetical protein